jgi:preprotein translocase subunit SecF
MFSIIQHRKFYFVLSGLLVAASVAALAVFGLRFGIDFTGGSLLEVRFADGAPDNAAVASALEPVVGSTTVQQSEDGATIIRMRDINEEAHQAALAALDGLGVGTVEELRFDSIGPTIGAELKRSGMLAIALGLVAIALFVSYAFRGASEPVASWQYGVITALVALLHDVLIPLGVFAVLGHTIGLEVDAAFIAAMLTVLGYSVNDTIIIFDRVRENLRRYGSSDFAGIVERSIRETLARSLNTSLTVLFAVGAVWWFGGASVRPFALAMLLGLVAGVYSSIFLASTLLVALGERLQRKRT